MSCDHDVQNIIIILIAVGSVVIFPLSFVNSCFLSFYLVSLAKGLSIILIFSKNQALLSLIFFTVGLFLISLISTLIFIIFFPTLLFEGHRRA